MPNLGIRTDASGTFGALTFGGVDKVTVGNNGIQAGSYAPDSITAAELAPGALIETSPLHVIGYGPGAGGTVTQATSKSTTVTLNKPCGAITMNSASLAAGTSIGFSLNNSLLTAFDLLFVNQVTAGTPAAYNVWVDSKGAGVAFIIVKNISGVALAEAPVINFAIIKGVIA